jgi:predicted nucleotidyltransferase/HEPN domain-containing protein
MRTLNDIDTLSPKELDEIALITERIKNAGSVALIILYGSYARGEQVRNHDGKMSDYDLLIITAARNEKSIRRLKYLLDALFHDIERRVSCEVESLEKISKRFKENYYFYADVRRDGIVLYKRGNAELPEPEDLSPERQLEISEKYFKAWYGASVVNIKTAKDSRLNKKETDNVDFNKKAAFELQQCVENCYKTIELVHDRYAPKEHHLEILRGRTVKIASRIYEFFPTESKDLQKDYEYLDEAYLRARYDDTYIVSETQLDYWQQEAVKLMEYTEQICKAHIEKLKLSI